PGSVSILTIAQSLSGSVGVSLDAGRLAQLQSEWQLHVAADGPPGGTNFQQAQVMAVFILDWLSRNGQAPLSNLTLTPGPNGGVALGANDQGSDAWVKPALDLLAALLNQGGVPCSPGANGIPGGPTPGATGGGGSSGPLSTGDPPPPEEAPTGEALVEYKR